MPTTPDNAAEAPVDLGALAGSGGVVWSASPAGVHVNLVVLAPGDAIAAHHNDEVDVLLVFLAGHASVTVDGRSLVARDGHALEIARGTERSISAGGDGVRYLSIHRERSGISIGRRDG